MTETKVYGINPSLLSNIQDEIFDDKIIDEVWIGIAEEQGNVWSLKGFQEDFNKDVVNSDSLFIRFI